MTYSTAAKRDYILARHASDFLVTLVTISGTGLSTPFRMATASPERLAQDDISITYGITSRGHQYTWLGLQIVKPSSSATEAPRAQMSVSGLNGFLTPAIGEMNTPPYAVLFEEVMASAPDDVEREYRGMSIGGFAVDKETARAELVFNTFEREAACAVRFNHVNNPGLY